MSERIVDEGAAQQYSFTAAWLSSSEVESLVPEISRFFGIVIAMYHREHAPAHFHARYGSQKGTVRIEDGYVEGNFPPRVRAMLLEWWDRHRDELAENWRLPPLE